MMAISVVVQATLGRVPLLAVAVSLVAPFCVADLSVGAAVLGRQSASTLTKDTDVARATCEREAEKLTGATATRIGGVVRAPRKLRDAAIAYPELPRGTSVGGVWLGEMLIDTSGSVVRVWTVREIRLEPPFPAFNAAITDAIQQWQYEPLRVQGVAKPFCMAVSINIDWP